MSRRTSRLQRSPNTSMVALIGHPDRGSYASPILLALYNHQALRSRQAVANHKRKEPPVLRQVAEGVLIHESEFCQPVVAGFSTHPHWDHLLWHARLGAAPRYGTARCAATVRDRLSDARG